MDHTGRTALARVLDDKYCERRAKAIDEHSQLPHSIVMKETAERVEAMEEDGDQIEERLAKEALEEAFVLPPISSSSTSATSFKEVVSHSLSAMMFDLLQQLVSPVPVVEPPATSPVSQQVSFA